MPVHVSSTCAHHQEVKTALHSLWYHNAYRWPSRAQPVHRTATYSSDDTRGCVMQFCPPDDEHMCSKHVEAGNKLIVKQKVCASSWLIAEMNILSCTVSKTSKLLKMFLFLMDYRTWVVGRAFWGLNVAFQFLSQTYSGIMQIYILVE